MRLIDIAREAARTIRHGIFGDSWYVSWHNRTKQDGKGDFPIEGRASITVGRTTLAVSWNLWTHFAHLGVEHDPSEAEVVIMAALPPVALWFSLESWSLLGGGDPRELKLSFHDSALWWRVWSDPTSWSEKRLRWRDGNLCLANLFFGQQSFTRIPIGAPVPVVVPMPERSYEGTVQLEELVLRRPRWFTQRVRSAKVEMREPIPVPGKGENSWDCDEDAIYSQSGPARTVAEAVAGIFESFESALDRRMRYASIT
jgi:hypothetical protein